MSYEWFEAKAAKNAAKHGVDFAEATTAFADPFALDEPEHVHPGRRILIGVSSAGRILFVVFEPIDDEVVRIIHARPASPTQRKRYAEE